MTVNNDKCLSSLPHSPTTDMAQARVKWCPHLCLTPTKQVLVLSFNLNGRVTEKKAVTIWLIRKNIWSKKDFEESAQGQISSFLALLRFSCSGLNHLSPTNYLIRQRKCLIH